MTSLRSVVVFAAVAAALQGQQPAPAVPATPVAAATETQQPTPAPKPFEVWRPRRPTKEADYQVAKWGPRGLPSPGYAFRAARVLPITAAPIDDGVVVTRNGLIEAVGRAKDVVIPADYERIDCGSAILVPGLVEMHCHVASESFDLNDTVHPTNPEVRTLDLIGMDHDQLRTARAGGISTALYIPGSGSNMGGFGTLTKTWGRSPEEALVRFPGSLKIAQAGNPERGSGDLGTDMMGMSENIRLTLLRAPLLAHHDPAPPSVPRPVIADQGEHHFRFRFHLQPRPAQVLLADAVMWQRMPLTADTTRGMPCRMFEATAP
jgi:hypothetical protein